ncbi:MAG: hypothetical protein ACK58L_05625 [Planctomycetota bacterium]
MRQFVLDRRKDSLSIAMKTADAPHHPIDFGICAGSSILMRRKETLARRCDRLSCFMTVGSCSAVKHPFIRNQTHRNSSLGICFVVHNLTTAHAIDAAISQ